MSTISESTPKHARPASTAPEQPELSHAERSRTLLHLGRTGTLSTLSRKQPGFPFGSLMPYAPDESGHPLLLISSMAMHTQNLKANPHASLFVAAAEADADVLGAARVTLIGDAVPVRHPAIERARELYLERHPGSSYWVDFEDFAFFRLEVADVYFVGGFGVMGWVTAPDYIAAHPDPLADAQAGILAHMNADHADALALLVLAYAGKTAQRVTMLSVDRLGFGVRVETEGGRETLRIPFPYAVNNAMETRSALVEMVRAAQQQQA